MMDAPNDPIHSFIVRVWQEEPEADGAAPVWRGHITHAVSRERRYITDLRQIIPFIVSYLPAGALQARSRHQRWHWIRRHRHD